MLRVQVSNPTVVSAGLCSCACVCPCVRVSNWSTVLEHSLPSKWWRSSHQERVPRWVRNLISKFEVSIFLISLCVFLCVLLCVCVCMSVRQHGFATRDSVKVVWQVQVVIQIHKRWWPTRNIFRILMICKSWNGENSRWRLETWSSNVEVQNTDFDLKCSLRCTS